MIQFYFCNPFKEKMASLTSLTKEKIEKKFLEYQKRESLNNIGNIDSLSGGETFILKIKQPESRIIIQLKEVKNNFKVYFVRDIITNVKFDREYGRILYSKIKKGDWINENPLPETDIESFLSDYNSKQKEKNKEIYLEMPPEELTAWFNQFDLALNNEVFESKEWVAYALENNDKKGMSDKYVNTFRMEIKNIFINQSNENCKLLREEKNVKIYSYENNNIGLIFSKIKIVNMEYILLQFGAHITTQKDYWENCKNIAIDNLPLDILNEENLYRISFRSYPKWTLNDDELWFRITKSDENSNLSLTTEQVDFLKNFKFPCYINGQAGSGKSTLLYYIFANVIYLKYSETINGNIVFLTENEQLLDDSSKNVFDLLENNPEFHLPHEEIDTHKEYFDSFKNFLLKMLNEDDIEYFQKDKYLHFPIFKNFYEKSTIKNKILNEYSAEEAWFVISTYIYGQDINKKITSEIYEKEIPLKSRKISIERFKEIEKFILPFYDSLLEKGFWDKLKIIRYINKNINLDLKPKYDVIICDEAQDFCKVELGFILKQSIYLQYDLSKVEQFPVVFAGDANQTVNPTGFSDAEMTSLLYQELKEINFEHNKDNIFYSPNLNYRSTSQVVNLANFIQYYRIKNLSAINKMPQESKRPNYSSKEAFNIFLDYEKIENNIELKNTLLEKLKYKIFIIPINSEEKDIYKNNSKLLSLFKDLEIKTSVESKGAEYKQVVLYGFGEYFLNNFSLDNNQNEFQIMYYFNKLYVGITRAKTELIIIDSVESKKDFWEKLICNADITNQNAWSVLKNIQSDIIVYNPDSINNMILSSTKVDALDNANEDKKLGEHYLNPSRLKVAASQYLKLGNNEEANYCLGFAEEINHNYKAAAGYYQDAKKYELASNSLFKGRYFNDLFKLGVGLQSIEYELRVIISRIMNNDYISTEEINTLHRNKDYIPRIILEIPWREDLIKNLSHFLEKAIDEDYIYKLIDISLLIVKENDIVLYNVIGQIEFSLENYKKAFEMWEKIDFYNNKNYYIAKYKYYEEKKDYENKVIFLKELIRFDEDEINLTKYQEIITIHEKNISEIQKNAINEYYLVILESYIILDDLSNYLIFVKEVREKVYKSELEECYKTIFKRGCISKKMLNYLIIDWLKLVVFSDEFDNSNIDKINSIYKTETERLQIPYHPFSVDEIKNLIENPTNKSNHLTNITINNFRQFKQVKIENIGQFNLIVGDNNVGKTSLLESLLFTKDINIFCMNLAFAYISRKNINLIRKESGALRYEVFNDFIDDFFNMNDTLTHISFVIEEKRDQWNFILRKPNLKELKNEFGNTSSLIEEDFICLEEENILNIEELSTIIKRIEPFDIIKMQFIPFGKGFDQFLAKSFHDNINKDKKRRKAFEESMKVFIPNIERITVDTQSGIITIEETDKDETSSLHQFGEGANKLFRILVQLTLQKDNKLLIDEIDAGIHYSHFALFWSTVLKVAKENNVQLFVTTHNIECIQYFKEVIEENVNYQELSRVITLMKLNENKVKAYTYSFNEFEHEIDNEFEIRGGEF